ncbi:MAG TPA: hypothetical protein VFC21_04335, partial [Bryobacteraceae bacterium]|nr:hypothetical protein [Bryobacteraceae bacterium]
VYYVGSGQINAQVPYELTPGAPNNQVVVSAAGALASEKIDAEPGAPGIATLPNNGIIAQHLDGSLVTETAPVMPGEIIGFYLTGLGNTANQPADGNGAPLPPTGPLNPVSVTLNGTVVPTLFVGLTPGAVGLYQINLTIPPGTPDGDQIVTVAQSGAVSNVVILPVHR